MNEPSSAAAVLASSLQQRFGESFEIPEGLPNLDELARMASHVTHRRWSDRPLPNGLTRLLAACALSAPSKSDLQQADIVEVRDPARRAALAALLPRLPWFDTAPAIFVFCGNGSRFRRIFERAGQRFANEHLDAFFNPTVDAALVMMNFMRAATAAGLVYCPISLLRDQPDEVARILEMPAHVFPVAGLCVGYPAENRTVVPRLPLAETFRVDGYGASGEAAAHDANLDAYDQRRAAVEAGWGRANPEAWSQAKRKQYADAQRPDWGAFVRGRGFETR